MASQISSQREENFEDPTRFRPERWLNSHGNRGVDFSYLPFGYGVRSCLGKNMAETKIMLLTAKVNRSHLLLFDRSFQFYRIFSLYDNSESNTITQILKAD